MVDTKSRRGFYVRAFIGLAIVMFVATGGSIRAGSGGYYCGYGDCYITWDCPGGYDLDYDSLGGGECEVSPNFTTTYSHLTSICDIDKSCEGEEFSWSTTETSGRMKVGGLPLPID